MSKHEVPTVTVSSKCNRYSAKIRLQLVSRCADCRIVESTRVFALQHTRTESTAFRILLAKRTNESASKGCLSVLICKQANQCKSKSQQKKDKPDNGWKGLEALSLSASLPLSLSLSLSLVLSCHTSESNEMQASTSMQKQTHINPAYNPNSKVSRFILLPSIWYLQVSQLSQIDIKYHSLNATKTPPRNTANTLTNTTKT